MKLEMRLIGLVVGFFITVNVSEAQTKLASTAEEITITTSEGATLSGTLDKPTIADKHLIVLFVSSVIGTDRDTPTREKIAVNFSALCEALNEVGITTFRFDSRGVGKSTGDNKSSTIYTQASDVEDICNYFLKNKDYKKYKLGLIGHSEGGAVSEVVASKNKKVSFLVLLSTQGYAGWDFFKYQTEKYYENRGSMTGMKNLADSLFNENARVQSKLYDSLNKYDNYDSIKASIINLVDSELKASTNLNLKNQYQRMIDIWIQPQQIALRKFSPAKYLSKITCPVIAICGTKDDSVECYPNLEAIQRNLNLSGNKDITVKALKNVNHFYRTLKDGEVWNYADKNEKFSNEALQAILNWLR